MRVAIALCFAACILARTAAAELTAEERLQLVEDRLAIQHLMTAV